MNDEHTQEDDITVTDNLRKKKLDQNLQEFAREIGIICALEAGGKIEPQEAYKRIKGKWKSLKAHKKELYPKATDDNQAI
jgi:hypothetical protein